MQNTSVHFDNLHDLKTFLLGAMPSKGTLLVGICGFAGAGKTTLCRALSDSLDGKTTHFSCDRFSRYSFKEREKRIAAQIDSECDTDEENPLNWYDWIAIAQAITTLRASRQFTYRHAWNSESGELDATYSLKLPEEQSALILCDGIFLLHSPVREWFDLTVRVDCPLPVRLARGRARTISASKQSYLANLERIHVAPYFHRFSRHANLVWSNAVPN